MGAQCFWSLGCQRTTEWTFQLTGDVFLVALKAEVKTLFSGQALFLLCSLRHRRGERCVFMGVGGSAPYR